jgi:hypothetical protein
VSIVRVGLAETKHFAEGYDAIFAKKKGGQAKKRRTVASPIQREGDQGIRYRLSRF